MPPFFVLYLFLVAILVFAPFWIALKDRKKGPIMVTDEQIAKSAEWWMNALRNPTFRTLSDKERRSGRERQAEFAELLAADLRAQVPVPDDKILAFGVALEKRIREMVADPRKYGQRQGEIILSVDYDPCQNLHEALVEAGLPIRKDLLPWKTMMRIGPTGVSVKCGYGQPCNKIA